MPTIEELYKAQQSALGVDKIGFAAGESAKTPYTTDDLKKADEQILTAEKFKTGRGGAISEKKYSDTFK
jgi:hypothetical protein